jgi:hypothetical protein
MHQPSLLTSSTNFVLTTELSTPPSLHTDLAGRVNRNLKSSLIAFHSDNQTTWDISLPWLQLALNSSIHLATKNTPNSLIFRYSPVPPLINQWSINEILPNKSDQTTTYNWQLIRDNLKSAHRKYAAVYDQGRTPTPFRVGDAVWLQAHPLSSATRKETAKLMKRWLGPFTITSFLTPVTVELKNKFGTRKAHVSQIKFCTKHTLTNNTQI